MIHTKREGWVTRSDNCEVQKWPHIIWEGRRRRGIEMDKIRSNVLIKSDNKVRADVAQPLVTKLSMSSFNHALPSNPNPPK